MPCNRQSELRWRVESAAAATALSLMLVLVAGVLAMRPEPVQHETLAVTSDILHHEADEPGAFARKEPVDPGRLVAAMGAKLSVAKGWYTTYADPCRIRGDAGLHIVYRRGDEVATLILLPGRLPVDPSHVASRYASGITLVVIPLSRTEPARLLAGLDPVLYPL